MNSVLKISKNSYKDYVHISLFLFITFIKSKIVIIYKTIFKKIFVIIQSLNNFKNASETYNWNILKYKSYIICGYSM